MTAFCFLSVDDVLYIHRHQNLVLDVARGGAQKAAIAAILRQHAA